MRFGGSAHTSVHVALLSTREDYFYLVGKGGIIICDDIEATDEKRYSRRIDKRRFIDRTFKKHLKNSISNGHKKSQLCKT